MKAIFRPMMIATAVLVAGCGASAVSYEAANVLVFLSSGVGR